MTEPWWVRYAGRLDHEVEALRAAGWTVRVDEALKAAESRIVLHLSDGPCEDVPDLRVEFPDVYPFVRPIVLRDGLGLERHYNPVTGELCLLARSTIHWETDDTTARLLDEQLPRLLEAVAAAPGAAVEAALEERTPEPVRIYLESSAVPESGIATDVDWQTVPRRAGVMELAYFPGLVAHREDGGDPLVVVRGVIAKVSDPSGAVLAEADDRLIHDGMQRVQVRWAALDDRPLGLSPADVAVTIHERAPRLKRSARTMSRRLEDGRTLELEVMAAAYTDEVSYGEQRVDVAFIARGPRATSDINGQGDRHAAIRAFRTGPHHLLERVPAMAGMPAASVLQVGAGGLGAPLARHLAQAQLGRLTIMDHDHVDPATTPRYPGSVYDAGVSKVHQIASLIRNNHPYTLVTPIIDMVGRIRTGDPQRQDEMLDDLIAGHDLVVDATAEVGIQYLLADACRRLGVPYVLVSATEGAWGGIVARLRPDAATRPCYRCLQATLSGSVLPPRDQAAGTVAPAGCGSQTFVGTGFDLAPIAAEGARVVASTLSAEYPELPWDLSAYRLRDDNGDPIPGAWTAHEMVDCEVCASADRAA